MKKILIASIASLLAGCATVPTTTQYSRTDTNRGKVVQSHDTASAGISPDAPVMIRIIKEERKLELWKLGKNNTYEQIKAYDICAISGDLGPKKKQGDRQGPEGFYEITAGQLNPHSSEHLSINTGFPNARDSANKYTGSALMIHGGCSSAGCYAITDPAIEELYASVRDSLRNKKNKVQLQIYPFKMTAWRMFVEQNNPNYKFWTELKHGWDYFEGKRNIIPVSVKNRSYQIN